MPFWAGAAPDLSRRSRSSAGLPQLKITVLRSPDIGAIGVGEGTTSVFPRHFFEKLKLKPQQFYAEAQPTWKLGIKFLWGPRREFYYTFAYEYEHRFPELSRNNGFFFNHDLPYAGIISTLMAHDKVFARRPDGLPQFHNNHAFHIENHKRRRPPGPGRGTRADRPAGRSDGRVETGGATQPGRSAPGTRAGTAQMIAPP